MKRIILIILCALLLPTSSFAQGDFGFPLPSSNIEKFATHDSLRWEDYTSYAGQNNYYGLYGNSIGKLRMVYELQSSRRQVGSSCTATIISPKHILTNYHCVYDGIQDGGEILSIVGASLIMNFHQGNVDESQLPSYAVSTNPIEKNEQLDYAILEFLGSSPVNQYGYIFPTVREARTGESLFMIHHSSGEHKRITRRDCSRLDIPLDVSQRVQTPNGGWRRVNLTTDIPHFCDSLGGSSGSLVFAANDGAIVGLHFSGTDNNRPENERFNLFIDFPTIIANSRILSSADVVPSAIPEVKNIILPVMSTTHASGANGKYFNFDSSPLDAILGTKWGNTSFQIKNTRNGRVSRGIVWRNPNGAPVANSHGRWNDGTARSGDWRTGDQVEVQVVVGQTSILSIDHSSGTVGKYFNFDINDIDRIVGSTGWTNQTFLVKNHQTGIISNAVIWRNPNGGSFGNGHGRWNDGTAASGQWKTGDVITLFR